MQNLKQFQEVRFSLTRQLAPRVNQTRGKRIATDAALAALPVSRPARSTLARGRLASEMGAEMLSRLRCRCARGERTEADAEALALRHGVEAYGEARRRECAAKTRVGGADLEPAS